MAANGTVPGDKLDKTLDAFQFAPNCSVMACAPNYTVNGTAFNWNVNIDTSAIIPGGSTGGTGNYKLTVTTTAAG